VTCWPFLISLLAPEAESVMSALCFAMQHVLQT